MTVALRPPCQAGEESPRKLRLAREGRAPDLALDTAGTPAPAAQPGCPSKLAKNAWVKSSAS